MFSRSLCCCRSCRSSGISKTCVNTAAKRWLVCYINAAMAHCTALTSSSTPRAFTFCSSLRSTPIAGMLLLQRLQWTAIAIVPPPQIVGCNDMHNRSRCSMTVGNLCYTVLPKSFHASRLQRCSVCILLMYCSPAGLLSTGKQDVQHVARAISAAVQAQSCEIRSAVVCSLKLKLLQCNDLCNTSPKTHHYSAAAACAGYLCDTASHDSVWFDSRLSSSGTSATGTRTCKRSQAL
jgi:hypothetical protein